MSQVSVIIVNFNGRHLLPDCLSSLEAQTRPADEVLLVDNGSTDDSVAMVQRDFPWVRVVETGENLGFAGGNNFGIRESNGDVVILLNNDTLAGPGFVEELVVPLERDPSLSAVAGTLLFSNEADTVASAGIDVHENGLALDHALGTSWRKLPHEWEIFGASGGAAAFRRDSLEDVGGFADEFFLYLEDADLAWRMRLRNHRTVVRSHAWALHIYSASSNDSSGLKDYYLARNRAWTLILCWPRALWTRYWRAVLKYEIGALGYALVTRRWRSIFGRWSGWSAFFKLRRDREQVQSRVTSGSGELLYWICPAPSARGLLGVRRTIRKLTR